MVGYAIPEESPAARSTARPAPPVPPRGLRHLDHRETCNFRAFKLKESFRKCIFNS